MNPACIQVTCSKTLSHNKHSRITLTLVPHREKIQWVWHGDVSDVNLSVIRVLMIPFVVDTRVWPRAAAVGERLWADPVSGVQGAEPRLQRQRARLLSRGLRPDALGPAWCAQHDAKCF